ncbi:MAG: CHASE4 domain-containing protein, partial [Chloroflexota bacterium]
MIVGMTSLILIVALYAFAQIILVQGYVSLEQDTVARNVQRAINATQDEVTFLRSTNIDYAHWDDTYAYIQGLDDSYIDTNILDSVFSNYHLNFVLFVNKAGEIVYSQGFDLSTLEREPISPSLTTFVAHNEALLHPTSSESGSSDTLSGVVALPDGGILLAASSILPSNHQGTAQGALIWGRYMDDQLITELSDHTQLTLDLSSATVDGEANNFAKILPAVLNQSIAVQALDSENVAGYTLLKDIHDQPALILKVEMPRSIYQQGINSLSYF